MDFVPDQDQRTLSVPYFEDANNKLGVVGYSTSKTVEALKAEVETAMAMLGASVSSFQGGKFGDRYGYRIDFKWEGVPGRIDVAALPIRKETESRVEQAKRHALYSVASRLQAQYNSQLVMPGDAPLMPYMIGERGQTLTEWWREKQGLPALTPPPADDEAEWEEVEE